MVSRSACERPQPVLLTFGWGIPGGSAPHQEAPIPAVKITCNSHLPAHQWGLSRQTGQAPQSSGVCSPMEGKVLRTGRQWVWLREMNWDEPCHGGMVCSVLGKRKTLKH